MNLEQAFNKAVKNPENFYELDADGFHDMSDEQTHNINWRYVDADCAMDTANPNSYRSADEEGFSMVGCDEYYAAFDVLCDKYEASLV